MKKRVIGHRLYDQKGRPEGVPCRHVSFVLPPYHSFLPANASRKNVVSDALRTRPVTAA